MSAQSHIVRDAAFAVAISAKRRFRPVMLTSLSTMASVFPLSLVSSGQAAFLAPMAMAIVWGLGFSTILTLLLIPALYMINIDIQKGLKRLLSARRREAEAPESGRDEARVSVELPISGAIPEASGGGS